MEHDMNGPMGAGPLVSPWVSMWDIAWQSPSIGLVLAGMVFMLILAGLSLSMLDSR